MEDYREIRNLGQLRNARMKLHGALDSRRRTLELSWSHLREAYMPANILRLAFKGLTIDLSETVIGLAGRLKEHIVKKWDEIKSHRSRNEHPSNESDPSANTSNSSAEEDPLTKSERTESDDNTDAMSENPEEDGRISSGKEREGEETGNESDTENTDNTGCGETDESVGI